MVLAFLALGLKLSVFLGLMGLVLLIAFGPRLLAWLVLGQCPQCRTPRTDWRGRYCGRCGRAYDPEDAPDPGPGTSP